MVSVHDGFTVTQSVDLELCSDVNTCVTVTIMSALRIISILSLSALGSTSLHPRRL